MERPKVGVAAIVTIGRDDHFHMLMGKRLKSFGYGKYAFPGGHLESGEDPARCAHREVLEETGLNLTQIVCANLLNNGSINKCGYTNDIEGDQHYVTLYIHYHISDNIPETENGSSYIFPETVNTEPDKCAGWEWLSVDAFLERDIWEPVLVLIKQQEEHFSKYTEYLPYD